MTLHIIDYKFILLANLKLKLHCAVHNEVTGIQDSA